MTTYQTKSGKIILGDSLQVLQKMETDSVDAVITDPPYSSGGLFIKDRQQTPDKKYIKNGKRISFSGDNKDQRSFFMWAYLWAKECFRITKDKGYFLTFTDWRQLPLMTDVIQAAGFTWRGVIVWDKGRGARVCNTSYFRHQCEYVIWATKGGTHGYEGWGPWDGCYQFPIKQKDKFHMTGKPTPLMEELVKVAPVGGVVLDPFSGSGTTAVACEKQGRKWICIEEEIINFEISVKRLEELKG